jgi:hypothetical protein
VEPMMTLSDRLREKIAAIGERWLADALAAYPEGARDVFRRQRDPFANPVGHALRVGMDAVLQGLVEGRSADAICASLDEVIKIRAVQEFTPSQALAFVFLLKDAVRAELGIEEHLPAFSAEWASLQRQIDQVALAAFDAYVRYRGQLCELRINEVKRSVAAIVERLNRRSPSSKSGEDILQMPASTCAESRGGCGL